MKPMKARYLALDAFPDIDFGLRCKKAGAVVSCWARMDIEASSEQVQAELESGSPWKAARVLFEKMVSEEDYVGEAEGSEFFHQCLIDEIVFHIVEIESELVGGDQTEEPSFIDPSWYKHNLHQLRSRGAFSLYSEHDGQWANGVSPNENEFLPIWLSSKEVEPWREYWSGYQVRHLDAKMLFDGMLEEANAADMFVGLYGGRGALQTLHPIMLRESMKLSGG